MWSDDFIRSCLLFEQYPVRNTTPNYKVAEVFVYITLMNQQEFSETCRTKIVCTFLLGNKQRASTKYSISRCTARQCLTRYTLLQGSIYTGAFLCAHSMRTAPLPKVSSRMPWKWKPTHKMPTVNTLSNFNWKSLPQLKQFKIKKRVAVCLNWTN